MLKKSNNKKSELELGIFHLLDLKVVKNIQSEQFYFGLEQNYKSSLFRSALSISHNIRNLAKDTNINYFNLWDSIKRTPISLTNLVKLSNYLTKYGFNKFDLETIQKNLEYIKGGFTDEKIFNPKFPFNLATKSGMRFIAHIYHDGSIGAENRQPHFRNKSLEECQEFLQDTKNIFGNFYRKIKKNYDDTYSIHLPTVIGDIMISIGYTKGDKTKNNAKTFRFLDTINDKELISVFLEKAFNDDGYVGKRSLGISQASLIKDRIKRPSNILLLDKLYLEKLGIRVFGPTFQCTYPNRYGICTKYSLNVYSKKDLGIFYKNVNPIDRKRRKLEQYLK
jgi:hypothetical protein|tara:strand:- start:143 stop:1150 length:1008 start_codon:yes stop_codon:yes gene_type:complete